MANIITGNNLGLYTSSLGLPGSQNGQAPETLGQGRERFYVNAKTGNLIIQHPDELLLNKNQNQALTRTYNSLGALDGDNNDGWRLNPYQTLAVTGLPNVSGSSVVRTAGDGSTSAFVFDDATGKYVSTDGDGAHDTLTYNGTTTWTYTDGSSRIREKYDNQLRLISVKDPDGNTTSYTYTSGLVTQITTTTSEVINGVTTTNTQIAYLDYLGTNLDRIRVVENGTAQTLVSYGYDTLNRLQTVTVDLSPADSSTLDGEVYTTTYTYDGNSTRVASITQSDGTTVSFTYDASNRLWTIMDGGNHPTTFTYDTINSRTDVTDALGYVTSYSYDAQGRLTRIEAPTVNGSRPTTQYAYDTDGNLTRITDPNNNVTAMQYDGNGNLILTRDALGDTIARTYNANNQLLTETQFTVPDPDGAGPALPQNPQTTRYVYDAENHLRFVVSPEGRVTEYQYNTIGDRVSEIEYAGSTTSTGGLDFIDRANSLDFDGIDDGVTFADPGLGLGPITVQAWINADDLSNAGQDFWGGRGIIHGNKGELAGDFYLSVDSRGAVSFAYWAIDGENTDGRVFTADGVITTGRWYQITATWDGATRRIYVNGVEQGTQATTTDTAWGVAEYAIGRDYYDPNWPFGTATTVFNGKIDDVSLYTGALSSSDVASLYTDANALIGSGTLKAQWKFDESDGLTAYNAVAGAPDGTLTGMSGNEWALWVPSALSLSDLTDWVATQDKTSTLRTDYSYDFRGQLSTATTYSKVDATGAGVADGTQSVTRYVYDQRGNLLQRVDGRGSTTDPAQPNTPYATTYTYDGLGRVLTTTQWISGTDAPQTTSVSYDDAFQTILTTAANGLLTTQTFDRTGRLTGIMKNSGGALDVTSYGYDADGRLYKIVDSTAVTTYRLYDEAGRQVADIDGKGNLTEYVYDANGQVTKTIHYATALSMSWLSSLATAPVPLATLRPAASTADQVTYNIYDAAHRLMQTIAVQSRNTSLKFDGTDDAVTFADPNLGTGSITIQAWISADSLLNAGADPKGGRGIIHSTHADATGAGQVGDYYLSMDSFGQISFAYWSSAGSVSTGRAVVDRNVGTNTLIQTGQWYHVVVEWNSATSTRKIFINGVQQTLAYQDTGSGWGTENAIGRSFGGGGAAYHFSGKIDDVRLYSGALSSADIANLYGNADATTSSGTLKAQWKFDDGAGKIAANSVNAALDGRFSSPTSGPQWMTVAPTTDEKGVVTQYNYDAAGQLVNVTQYATPVSTTTPGSNPVTVTTSSNDRTTRYFYDHDGKLLGTLDAEGYLTRRVYDSTGQLVETVAYATATAAGVRSTGDLTQVTPATTNNDVHSYFFYNAKGQLVGGIDGESYLTETFYDAAGHISSKIRYAITTTPQAFVAGTRPASPDNQTTSYTYDGKGQRISTTDPDGTVTRYTYDAAGNLISSTRADGIDAEKRTTTRQYDAFGRLTVEMTGVGSALLTGNPATDADIWSTYAVSHTYDSAGRRISTTDQNGHTTYFYYYKGNNRLNATVNALGEYTRYIYNALGQLTETIRYGTRINTANLTGGIGAPGATINNAIDSHTYYSYDLAGRLTATTDALGNVTTHHYDAFGNETSRGAQISASATLLQNFDYDHLGHLRHTCSDPAGINQTGELQYDAFGRVVFSIDGDGNSHAQSYDRLGRVVSATDPLSHIRYTTYDAFDRVLTQQDARGNTTSYSYDTLNRSMTVTTPEGVSVTTTRNRHGDVAVIQDGRGNTTSYDYDKNGNLKAITANGKSVTYTYDNADLKLTSVDQNNVTTLYSYDAAKRVLTRTVDPLTVNPSGLNLTTSYAYDAKGQAISVTDPNGIVTQTAYDLNGEVLTVTVDPTGLNLQTTYTYDGRGRTLTVTDAAGTSDARTTRYDYDALGRRVQEVIDPSGLNLNTGYSYDQDNNVTSRADANGFTTRYYYDGADRLIYTLDALNGVTQNDYDNDNRIIAVTQYANALSGSTPPVTLAAFAALIAGIRDTTRDRTTRTAYDKDGRVKFRVDALGGVTENVYDGNGNVVQQIVYANPIASTVANSVSAIGAALVSDSTRDQITFTVYDTLNRPVYNIDALGAVSKTEYDATGQIVKTVKYSKTVNTSTWDNRITPVTIATVETAPGFNATPNQDIDHVTLYARDAAGRVVYTRDALGAVVQNDYDANGNVIKQTAYAASIALNTPNAVADISTAVNTADPNNRVTYTDYDTRNLPIYSADPLGYVTQTQYDKLGRVTSTTKYANPIGGSVSSAGYILDPTESSDDWLLNLLAPINTGILGTSGSAVRFADFNGDGKDDMLRISNGTAYVALSGGNNFGSLVQWGGGFASDMTQLAVGDFNKDGKADVFQKDGTQKGYVWQSQGNGFAAATLWDSNLEDGSVYLGDFNNDGRSDVLRVKGTGAFKVWLTNSTGTGPGTILASWGTGVGGAVTRIADFNGDGRDDILQLLSDGTAKVWLTNSTGNGSIAPTGAWVSTGHSTSEQVGDFNGDGKADLLKLSSTSSTAWLGSTTGLTTSTAWNIGSNNGTGHVTDADGDGKADDIIEFNVDGHAYAWLSQGSQFSAWTLWGDTFEHLPSDMLVDVSGDGKADAVQVLPGGTLKVWTYGTKTLTTLTVPQAGSLVTDALHDETTQYAYDKAGRLLTVTDARNVQEKYTYDGLGNKKTYTDKNNHTWDYTYDALGRLTDEKAPSVTVTRVDPYVSPDTLTAPATSTYTTLSGANGQYGSSLVSTVDSGGNITAVWTESSGSGYQLWSRRYDAESNTWSSAKRLDSTTNTYSVYSPSITATKSGYVGVVWRQYNGSTYDIWVSICNPTTLAWSTPANLGRGDVGTASSPSIGISDDPVNGVDITVAWTALDSSSTYNNIWSRTSTNGGSTWAAATELDVHSFTYYNYGTGTNVTVTRGSAYSPKVVTDTSGNAFVIWRQLSDINSGYIDLYVSSRAAGSTTWSGQAAIENENLGDVTTNYQVGTDGSGNLFVVWTQSDGTSYHLRYNAYSTDTNLWSGMKELAPPSTGYSPTIALGVDTQGNALVAWTTSGGTVAARRYIKGVGLQDAVDFGSIGSGTLSSLKVALDATGNAIVSWLRGTSANNYYYNQYLVNGGWQGAKSFGNSLRAYVPQVLFQPDGTATALFQEYSNSAYIAVAGKFVNGATTEAAASERPVTHYTYDAFGDVLSRAEAYNELASRPTEVRTTSYSYDKLGHQTQITLPTTSVYSATLDNPAQNGLIAPPANAIRADNVYWAANPDTLLMEKQSGYSIIVPASAYGDTTPSFVSAAIYDMNGTLIKSASTIVGNQATPYNGLWKPATDWSGQVNLSDTELAPGTYNVTVTIEDSVVASSTSSTTNVDGDGTWGPIVTTYTVVIGDSYTTVNRTETSVTPTTVVTYDALGHAVVNKDVSGNYTYKVYDKLGRLHYEIDGETYLTAYGYDACGNRNSMTRYANALGFSSHPAAFTESEVAGLISTKKSSANDRTITYVYDVDNHLIEIDQPSVLNYDSTSGQSVTTNPITKNYYDKFGGLIHQDVRGPNSTSWQKTYFYYDNGGHRIAQVDPLGYVTEYQYDAFGNLVDQIEYANTTSSWSSTGYTTPAASLPSTSPNAAAGYDRETRYSYDVLNRKVAETRVHVEYDSPNFLADTPATALGNVYVTADGNLTTRYGYDAAGNLAQVTDPTTTTYTYYDAVGSVTGEARIARVSDAINRLTTFSRDIYGNAVIERHYANGASSATPTSYSGFASPTRDQATYRYFDNYGHVTRLVNGEGDSTYYSYDVAGNVAKQWRYLIDADGHQSNDVTTYGYDRNGRQVLATQIVDPRTTVKTQVRYNSFGEITARGINDGYQETYTYDKAGRMLTSNRDGGVSTTYSYDLLGRTTKSVSGGLTTITKYDALGRVLSQQQPAFTSTYYGSTTPIFWQTLDRWGNVLTSTNPRGYQTVYRYDYGNHLIEMDQTSVSVMSESGATSNVQPITRYYYDADGRQVGTLDANGNLNLVQYDSFGDLIAEYHADGGEFTYGYDQFGQKTSFVDALSHPATNYGYDRNGRLITETDAYGNVRRYTYDMAGNRTSDTDATGVRTRYAFDNRGNLVKTVLPGGGFTLTTYDAYGHKTSQLDEAVQTWTYDYFGNLQSRTDMAGNTYTYAYVAGTSRLDTEKKNGVLNLSYGYFENGWLKTITQSGYTDGAGSAPVSTVETYDYNANGSRIAEKFTRGSTTYADAAYTYDGLERLMTAAQNTAGNQYSLTYTYDAVGNRRSANGWTKTGTATTSTNTTNYYTYDAMNRMTLSQGILNSSSQIVISPYVSSTKPAQGVIIAYDLNGNRTSVTYYEKSTSTAPVTDVYGYDNNNRLVTTKRNNVVSNARTYDAAGRVVNYTTYNSSGGQTENRIDIYNTNGWLKTEAVYGSGTSLKYTVHYDMPKYVMGGLTQYPYDRFGNVQYYRVDYPNGDIQSYTYNYGRHDGYLVDTIDASGPTGTGLSTFYYDVNSQLTKVDDKANTSNNRTMIVDAQGEILQKTQSSKTQYYYYANGKPIGSSGGSLSRPDFDYNYTKISAQYPANTPSSYVVADGDTLQSVSAAVYGDASFWFLIADANGLDDSAVLTEGQQLTIPNKVTNIHNNANTFKPYNPAEIIGNTTPTLPSPPSSDSGCGGFLQVIVIAVAVVATVFTAGAAAAGMAAASGTTLGAVSASSLMTLGAGALSGGLGLGMALATGVVAGAVGSIVSQGVAMTVGLQDKFSWSDVGMSALSAGVGAGTASAFGAAAATGELTGTQAGTLAASAAAGNVLTQGVMMLAGYQDRFDWRTVSAAAVAAPLLAKIQGPANARVTPGDQILKDLEKGTVSQGVNILVHDGGRMEWAQVAGDAFGHYLVNGMVAKEWETGGENQQRRAEQSVAAAKGQGGGFSDPDFLVKGIAKGTIPDPFAATVDRLNAGLAALDGAGMDVSYGFGDGESVADFRAYANAQAQGAADQQAAAALASTTVDFMAANRTIPFRDPVDKLAEDIATAAVAHAVWQDDYGHAEMSSVPDSEMAYWDQRYREEIDPRTAMAQAALQNSFDVQVGRSTSEGLLLAGQVAGGELAAAKAAFALKSIFSYSAEAGFLGEGVGGISGIGAGMGEVGGVANSGVRETVLANLRESAVARGSSQIETFFAKSAQIESGYAADAWNATLLRQGDVVYALSPTKNPQFFTDLRTLQGVQFDTLSVSEALQVRPHSIYGYRPDITGYRVTQDVTIPGGTTAANPWYGPGGGTQFFIRDSGNYLEPISTINLRPR